MALLHPRLALPAAGLIVSSTLWNGGSVPTSSLIRQDLVPMVAGYLVLMTVLGVGLRLLRRSGSSPGRAAARNDARRAGAPASGGSHRGWAALARLAISTAVGGYILLAVVVVAYYYGVARVGGQFLQSAFTGTALLLGIATPVFAVTSWLVERARRRGSRS
jgi:hypothetical protein